MLDVVDINQVDITGNWRSSIYVNQICRSRTDSQTMSDRNWKTLRVDLGDFKFETFFFTCFKRSFHPSRSFHPGLSMVPLVSQVSHPAAGGPGSTRPQVRLGGLGAAGCTAAAAWRYEPGGGEDLDKSTFSQWLWAGKPIDLLKRNKKEQILLKWLGVTSPTAFQSHCWGWGWGSRRGCLSSCSGAAESARKRGSPRERSPSHRCADVRSTTNGDKIQLWAYTHDNKV